MHNTIFFDVIHSTRDATSENLGLRVLVIIYGVRFQVMCLFYKEVSFVVHGVIPGTPHDNDSALHKNEFQITNFDVTHSDGEMLTFNDPL